MGGALGERRNRVARGGYRLAVSFQKPLDEAMQGESLETGEQMKEESRLLQEVTGLR